MTLNHDQARAVYDAMCALNNVNGHFDQITLDYNIKVMRYTAGDGYGVSVRGMTKEHYDTQAAFAAAYGI